MSLPPEFLDPEELKDGTFMEKALLRRALEPLKCIPYDILRRRKVTMSDGTATKKRSLKHYIERVVDNKVTMSDDDCSMIAKHMRSNPPPSKEAFHYRNEYNSIYGQHNSYCIPHFWQNLSEPSAQESVKGYDNLKELYDMSDKNKLINKNDDKNKK